MLAFNDREKALGHTFWYNPGLLKNLKLFAQWGMETSSPTAAGCSRGGNGVLSFLR